MSAEGPRQDYPHRTGRGGGGGGGCGIGNGGGGGGGGDGAGALLAAAGARRRPSFILSHRLVVWGKGATAPPAKNTAEGPGGVAREAAGRGLQPQTPPPPSQDAAGTACSSTAAPTQLLALRQCVLTSDEVVLGHVVVKALRRVARELSVVVFKPQ